ncbi:hypothetical protein ACLMJK_007595 [Lecanora helva]
MSSAISLLSLFLAASTLTSRSLAIPQAAPAATVTPINTAASAAAAQAASAAAAYSDQQAYLAASASDAAYYATASGASGSLGAPYPQQTGPDQCGPKTPDPRVVDTCDSFVEKVSSPHPYGVQCLKDAAGTALNTTTCESLIQVMCTNEFQHAGEWVWATGDGCSLGSYLPSETIQGAAQWPSQINCEELIYGAMLQACTENSQSYNVAAVNLINLPNAQSSGSQVNVGYPSYLIAQQQPREVGDAGNPTAVQIDATSVIAAQNSQDSAAFSSESALLATMTGTAAAQALSDLNAYRTMAPTDYGV